VIDESATKIKRDKDLLQEKVRGLFDSIVFDIDEKGYLIQLMHQQDMRDVLTDILSEITQPLKLDSFDCLKLVADIQRFVLTLFVHEDFNDFKLLYVILESSQNVFWCKEKKRKVYLSALLSDHGIWSDMNAWKECIDYMLKLKIEDAVRRKKRKEQIEK